MKPIICKFIGGNKQDFKLQSHTFLIKLIEKLIF